MAFAELRDNFEYLSFAKTPKTTVMLRISVLGQIFEKMDRNVLLTQMNYILVPKAF